MISEGFPLDQITVLSQRIRTNGPEQTVLTVKHGVGSGSTMFATHML